MRQAHPWNYWLLGWLLLLAGHALSQDAVFNSRHFSIEDGMSSRFVTNIIQDRQGFIWIGTDYGVNRFDGRNFKVFNYAQHKLRSNNRTFLYLDVNGKIWVNNERQQVDIIDPVTEVVTPVEKLVPELAGKSIVLRDVGLQNVIWGSVDNGRVFKYDGCFQYIEQVSVRRQDKNFRKLFPTPWGTLMVAEYKGLSEYDDNGNKINYFPLPDTEFSATVLSDTSLLMLSFQPKGEKPVYHANFWEIKKDKAPKLLPFSQNERFVRINYLETYYASIGINRDPEGRIWVTFLNNIYVFDSEGKLLEETSNQEGYWRQFESHKVFFDEQGQAWVRAKEGVFVISLQNPGIRKLLQNPNIGISVRDMVEHDKNTLYSCTYSGFFRIDLKTGQHKKLSDVAYYGAMKASDGSIWLGTHSNSVARFDTELQRFEKVNISEKLSRQDELLRPFEDPKTGQIYIGCRKQGLLVYDNIKCEIAPYPKLNQFAELANLELLHFLPTEDCIWLCTSDGLYQMDRQKGIVARFNHFPSNYFYHLHIDKDGTFWMSSRGGGLIKWFRKSNLVKNYNAAGGLSNDIIYAAYDDGEGYLWLPSNYGLMKFEKSTGTSINYLPEEGVSNEEFNASSHCMGSDGTFYFGGLSGITAFKPSEINDEKLSQSLVVVGLKVLSGNALEDRLAQFRAQKEIVVASDERYFSLEFALLDFLASKQLYAWRIEGIDKGWTYQRDNTVRFNALPYGKYKLRIKGQGAGNKWSKNELVIPITVLTPFYMTWKFALFCALGLGLLTYLFIRWRTAWLRREKERLTHLVEENTRELIRKNVELESTNRTKDRLFGIIAHDLRSPLVTLGGLARKVAFLMRQHRFDEIQALGETVEDSVASVRNLLDNLLKWSIVQDGKFPNNPESLPAAEIAEEVVELYGVIAESKGIRLTLQNINEPLVFADRNSVSTIIRNLVDNAIKFTHEGGQVTVKVEGRDEKVFVEVKDNGVGIQAALMPSIFELRGKRSVHGTNGEKGNGLGLVLCRELVEICQGTISVQNRAEGGTAFVVGFPMAVGQTITSAH